MDLGESAASFLGENGRDRSGYRVAGAGDVNGDGFDDILVSAYRDDDGGNDAGQVYLIFGRSSGWSMDTSLSDANASFWGEGPGDRLGQSIAGAGDVNGDGYDDILIGSSENGENGESAGQAYLIFGRSSGWSMDINVSSANASYLGEDEGDGAGWSIAGGGDVNGDGYNDFLIGAINNEEGGFNAGQTYLILGGASGWSMDTNLSLVNASFWGEHDGDSLGMAIACDGDVNDDGYDDIIISTTNNDDGGTEAGQTYLVLGRASGWGMDTNLINANASFWGEAVSDHSGTSISMNGDVNGDGCDDILIGAPGNIYGGAFAGQTYLVLGRKYGWSKDTDLSDANASFVGEAAGDLSGVTVACVGDVNSDGYEDLLIGAYNNDDGGTDAGQTYLIFGKSTGWSIHTALSSSDASYIGEVAGDESGWHVAGVGNVNGDEYDDFAICSEKNSDVGPSAGQTYLIFVYEGQPPVWNSIPLINAVEDVPFTFNFSGNVSDPDVSVDDLFITSPSQYVTMIDGLNVTFLFPNGILTASVPLFLSDGFFDVPRMVTVNVQPVNDPPWHDLQEQQYATEDVPLTLDLSIHVGDVDNPMEDVFLIIDSPYASINGMNLTMVFPEGITEYNLRFNISDGLDEIEVELNFIIEPMDDPPDVADPGVITVTEDQTSVFDIAPFLSDVDTPIEDLNILVRDANCTVNGKELQFLYLTGGEDHTVTIEVSDRTTRVLADLIVHVNEVNDPPEMSTFPSVSILEDDEESIDLAPYIFDEETPMEQLVLECAHPNVLGIEGLMITVLYPEWKEKHTLALSIYDGEALTEGRVYILVIEVNDPPEHDIPEEQTAIARTPQTLDLSSHIWDSDNDITDLLMTEDSPYASSVGLELTVEFPDVLEEYDLWMDITDGIDVIRVKLHFTITIPDTPPFISDLNVHNGDRIGGIFVVTGNASDDNTVERVEIGIDGGDWNEATGTYSWRYDFDTDNLSHGIHVLQVRSWDGQQWSVPVSVNIFVDQVPTVTIDSPKAMVTYGKAFEAHGVASDDVKVNIVEVRIDEGNWTAVDYSDQWTYDVKVRNLKNGGHVLSVRAYDGEQYSETVTVTFKVKKEDNQASESISTMFVVVSLLLVSILIWVSRRYDIF